MSELGPGRVKTRVLALNTPILEKCILQLDAVSASSVAVSDSLRKHFRFGCSAHEFSHGLGQTRPSREVRDHVRSTLNICRDVAEPRLADSSNVGGTMRASRTATLAHCGAICSKPARNAEVSLP